MRSGTNWTVTAVGFQVIFDSHDRNDFLVTAALANRLTWALSLVTPVHQTSKEHSQLPGPRAPTRHTIHLIVMKFDFVHVHEYVASVPLPSF